ncbi:hypothetical protein K9M79_05135 [Candidatus Woesearchaeota archaeon]|nr:hypothetical protein [Candidatus Woesearchaeota archaeon]
MLDLSEKKGLLIIILILSVVALQGCDLLCGNDVCNSIPFIQETFFNCPQDCTMCDDLNRCTFTFINYTTQKCDYYNISDCCGNGICETDENCPVDCTDCDDNNNCTLDYYNLFISNCSYETVYGCCGNQLCELNENCASCSDDCGSCFELSDLIPKLNSELSRIYDYALERVTVSYEKEYLAPDSNIKIYEFEPVRFHSKQQMVEFMLNNPHNYFKDHRQLLEYRDFNETAQLAEIGPDNQNIVIRSTIHTNSTSDPRKSAFITYIGYPCKKNILIEVYLDEMVTTYYSGEDLKDPIEEEKNRILNEQSDVLKAIDKICRS